MQVTVKARYLKHTPDKIRSIIRIYVGKPLQLALKEVGHLQKEAAGDILKLVKSGQAAARAKEMKLEDCVISEFYCDEGPRLKRRIPRSRGRVSPFVKKNSHLTMVINENNPVNQVATKGKEDNGTEG